MDSSRKSITQQIKENILALVLSHRDIKKRLPSETALAKQYKVSRVTVREALSSLERRGIIVRKQGLGTFVNPNIPDVSRIQSHLDTQIELSKLIELCGCIPQSRLITHYYGPTDEQIADRLKIDADAATFTVHKIFYADGDPTVYTINIIPLKLESYADASQSIEEVDPGVQIYQLLEDCFGQSVAYQISGIEAEAADESIAVHLECQAGTPVLCIEEVVYNHKDQPIMFSRGYYLPGMIHFSLVRKPV